MFFCRLTRIVEPGGPPPPPEWTEVAAATLLVLVAFFMPMTGTPPPPMDGPGPPPPGPPPAPGLVAEIRDGLWVVVIFVKANGAKLSSISVSIMRAMCWKLDVDGWELCGGRRGRNSEESC